MENIRIDYIGKCLFLESEEERIVAVGDLHLGYEQNLREAGVNIAERLFDEMLLELKSTIEKAGERGKINKIVLLGDLKHDFSKLNEQERRELKILFKILRERCGEIVVIRGNHDNYLLNMQERGVVVRNYFIWKEVCFLHGDMDFVEIHDKKIANWIIGHLHPAINIREGVKVEKYKCFLEGNYKGKKIIICPSFFSGSEGSDVRDGGIKMPWKFDFGKFDVKIVGEGFDVLDFGRLGDI